MAGRFAPAMGLDALPPWGKASTWWTLCPM